MPVMLYSIILISTIKRSTRECSAQLCHIERVNFISNRPDLSCFGMKTVWYIPKIFSAFAFSAGIPSEIQKLINELLVKFSLQFYLFKNLFQAWVNFFPKYHLYIGYSLFEVHQSSIGNRHSRLSSFGTSNFFEKILCTRTGIFFIRYLGSSGPHLRELLLYSGLSPLHATGYWCLQTSGRTSKS